MQDRYLSRRFLNPENPQTSFVSCYHGESVRKTFSKTTFIVGDCYNTIKIHRCKNETEQDMIAKLKLMQTELDYFIDFLEKNSNEQ